MVCNKFEIRSEEATKLFQPPVRFVIDGNVVSELCSFSCSHQKTTVPRLPVLLGVFENRDRFFIPLGLADNRDDRAEQPKYRHGADGEPADDEGERRIRQTRDDVDVVDYPVNRRLDVSVKIDCTDGW